MRSTKKAGVVAGCLSQSDKVEAAVARRPQHGIGAPERSQRLQEPPTRKCRTIRADDNDAPVAHRPQAIESSAQARSQIPAPLKLYLNPAGKSQASRGALGL